MIPGASGTPGLGCWQEAVQCLSHGPSDWFLLWENGPFLSLLLQCPFFWEPPLLPLTSLVQPAWHRQATPYLGTPRDTWGHLGMGSSHARKCDPVPFPGSQVPGQGATCTQQVRQAGQRGGIISSHTPGFGRILRGRYDITSRTGVQGDGPQQTS